MAGDEIRVVGDWRGDEAVRHTLVRLSVCLSVTDLLPADPACLTWGENGFVGNDKKILHEMAPESPADSSESRRAYETLDVDA
jgi:hypothetical protein